MISEMTEPAITPELVAKHNLTPEEYAHAVEILGRTPSYTELGIFSVMWSEHCSYKNTRLQLKKFPTTGPSVLVKAGEENAGVIRAADRSVFIRTSECREGVDDSLLDSGGVRLFC